jgi:hypothetical protein
MSLAILTKESAYVFPVLLTLLVADGRRLWRQLACTLPFYFIAGALFAYRLILFGGIGGYQDQATGRAQVLTLGVHTLKAFALRTWSILWFPINWSREPDKLLAALLVLYLIAAVWLATATVDPGDLLVPLGFVLVSILPPLHLLLIGPDLSKSRLLYLPSVGFCLMLALALDGLTGRMRYVIPGLILVFHWAALEHNLNLWQYASAKAEAAATTAGTCVISGLPRSLRGVPFFANGFPEALELQHQTSNADRRAVPCELGMGSGAERTSPPPELTNVVGIHPDCSQAE